MKKYLELFEITDENQEGLFKSKVMTEGGLIEFAETIAQKEVDELYEAKKVIENDHYHIYSLHESYKDSFNKNDYLELFEIENTSKSNYEEFRSEVVTEQGLLDFASSLTDKEEDDIGDAMRIIESSTLGEYEVYSIQKSFPDSLYEDLVEDAIFDAIELEIAKNIDYDQELKDDFTIGTGGISYEGETLRDFMNEAGLPIGNTKLSDINKSLEECGIKKIVEQNNFIVEAIISGEYFENCLVLKEEQKTRITIPNDDGDLVLVPIIRILNNEENYDKYESIFKQECFIPINISTTYQEFENICKKTKSKQDYIYHVEDGPEKIKNRCVIVLGVGSELTLNDAKIVL